MVDLSIRSYVVIQFSVCFSLPVCLPDRILYVYVSIRVSVRPPVCIFLCDIVCYSISLYVLFPFVRPSDRPSVLSSFVRMNACVYKHARDIPYF